MTFIVNVLFTCILLIVTPGSAVIRTVWKYSRNIHRYHICPRTFFFGDAVVLLRESYRLFSRNSYGSCSDLIELRCTDRFIPVYPCCSKKLLSHD